MPSKEDDLRSFQQLTAELRDPVVCLLRDGKEHLVSYRGSYLRNWVARKRWAAAFRHWKRSNKGQCPRDIDPDDPHGPGREAVLAAVIASLAKEGLAETAGSGDDETVRLRRPLGPELERRLADMEAAVAAAARAALGWLADGQRRTERELHDRLRASLPGEWGPITKRLLGFDAYLSLLGKGGLREDGPWPDRVVWLEAPGTAGAATGGGGEGAGGGAAALGGAAPPPRPRPAAPPAGAPEAGEGAVAPATLVPPDLPHHELAGLFPPPTEAEYAKLRDDIQAHGQRVPAWTCRGRLLDGRSRARACQELGLPLLAREWGGPGSLIAFVVSLNLHRRHLSVSQLALVGAKIKEPFEAEARQRMRAGKAADPVANLPQGRAREQAAQAVHVSERSVDAAAKVLEHGSPGLVRAVEAGQASVAAAAELAELPAAEQEEAVARGPQAVKARAGQLRRRKAEARQARQGGRGATAPATAVPGPGKAGGAAGREGEGSFTLTLPPRLPALGAALAGALVERLGREGAAAALEAALDRVKRPGA